MQNFRGSAGAAGRDAAARQEHGLTFQRTIPRHMVHRAAVAEVFVTDAVSLGEDRFLVGAQWPRDHALYHPDAEGRSDPLLVAETIRQALVYLAHWYYRVPLTHHFVGRDIDFEVTDIDALRIGPQPLPVVLDARWVWVDNRPPQRYGMRLEVGLSVGGRECGRGSLQVIAVDDRRYELLRRRAGGSPAAGTPASAGEVARQMRGSLDPSLVGRLRSKDSFIVPGASPGQWQLRVDPDHAILFDHPTDHVPLMVILEGIRQLGHLLVSGHRGESGGLRVLPVLTSVATDCQAFAELDEPIHLVVHNEGRTTETANAPRVPAQSRRTCRSLPEGPDSRRLRIEAVQGGRPVAVTDSGWIARDLEPAGQDEALADHG
ncbi:ScbA/BarX family gamma-butyrolactone biosynthesis protein [Streptomyces sp. RKAG290]|uniref:ScbA/BarX family gamma-butyrolactone biosynthesis protein n=1 Tax=Streptomyces sp. RKAG290 TaxID=2888348 RepID=UPI002033FC37|nr:ScbA/BarX family gamma-butyrolactone biosynthesis protein [Streptomyces sp. RKAG290]MCM2416251.1 gamma-butyrolactone biosynthesis protein [Streptomyces sp. RKAG290]